MDSFLINESNVEYTDVNTAREMFAKDRFATETTGIDIVAVDKGYAKCMMKIDDRHLNALDSVMGGAIYTLADFTFAVATNFNNTPTVTVVAQVSYLSAAKGKIIYAESRLIKDGRRNCFYEIVITDELGTNVASVNITGAHL